MIIMRNKKIKSSLLACLCFILMAVNARAAGPVVYFYGSVNNDLYQLLKQRGFTVKKYATPKATVKAAVNGAGVFITAAAYPQKDALNIINKQLLQDAARKKLRLYVEYPSAFPGLDIPEKSLETNLERAVITSPFLGDKYKPMSLFGIQNCHILPVKNDHPLIVLAKVVGFDKAEYGLNNTVNYPLLFEKENALVSMTGLSNFKTGRYAPKQTVTDVWNYIITRITGKKTIIKNLPQDVWPAFQRDEKMPAQARITSIKKGIEWFKNGRFMVHPSWKSVWENYGKLGKPVGPPLDKSEPNGDGSLGIIEGHTSTIYYDGTQQYRYWIRADVQGEASMALAAAGNFLHNDEYKKEAANLIDYLLKTSNMRADAKNDPSSPAYGLIGWATSNAGTFYGDDNSRAILGMIGASAYLKTNKWDKEIAEAILGNFRTTGRQGFRGERLEEADIIKNGWQYYYNRDLQHILPHFESWMWACYLWLYDKTGYQPLLDRTKEAIRITMEAYPKNWLWGSSMQMQRARMILPLAWLVRVENTEQHRKWLDLMINEVEKYQDESGAIQEEIGQGKGSFKELKSNNDYGSDEGSMVFRNGEKASCMLYTCNFALFGLNEAVQATGNAHYKKVTSKLSDFLTRIQVNSTKHKDLDGAWFRGFDYGHWDYWASNSDAGWGTWCTLTGWIQSWIVTSQIQIQQHESFWDVAKKAPLSDPAKATINVMMKQ
jgi:hypothetical protein